LQPEFGPAHLLLGVSWLALGKNAEAARELKIAEKLMPAEPQVHLQLARAYNALEEHFAAVDQYRQVTRLAPRDAEYVYLLARSWAELSRSSVEGDRQARFQLRASAPSAFPGTLEPGEV
jgi:predicted Zn-dependent protease